MKKSMQLLAAMLLSFAVGGAQAITLTDLLDDGSITVGDKVFDEWRIIFQDSSSGNSVNTDDIVVSGLDDGGDLGVEFVVNNDALSVVGADFDYIDFMIGFRVTAADGMLINGTSLNLLQGGYGGDGTHVIEELVGTTALSVEFYGDQDLAELYAEASSFLFDPSDSATFAPQQQIYVSKNIAVWADADGDNSSLQRFSQRFSQEPASVPLPAPLALLALGLIGLGWSRRRH